jgi:hypothetical protein
MIMSLEVEMEIDVGSKRFKNFPGIKYASLF